MDKNERLQILKRLLNIYSGTAAVTIFQKKLQFASPEELAEWLFDMEIEGIKINAKANELIIDQVSLDNVKKLLGESRGQNTISLSSSAVSDSKKSSEGKRPSFAGASAKDSQKVEHVTIFRGTSIVQSEMDALESIEQLTGRELSIISEIKWDSFGFQVRNGHVIGLSLYNQNLTWIPETIKMFTKLEVLNVYDNYLESLPDSFSELKTIKALTLSKNRFSHLPKCIFELLNLEDLFVRNNQLEELPPEIGKLAHLRELALHGNKLKALPETIGNLKNLHILSLSNNLLEELPNSIGNLSSLGELYLEKNQLASLPETIGNLGKLYSLTLPLNSLTSLPTMIGNCSSLQYIYLGKNLLSDLPESIGQLTNLRELYLEKNQLTSLPASFGNLTNLRGLTIAQNNFRSLPESMLKLKNLQYLYLNDNKLGPLSDSFRKWIDELQSHGCTVTR